ncbi:hypothetical protein AGMMS49942_16080 [Spirochaetia bacterium]|nr:hypothetical protein AGMMS49942_16080 [Spirochaetia bacterium]
MKRINHGLIVGLAVLLLAALSFVGCESPTEAEVVTGPAGKDGTGTPGTPGAKGADAPGFITSGASSATILYALAHNPVVVLDTVTIVSTVGQEVIRVPTGKTLKLVGVNALAADTILDASKGTLDISQATSIDFGSGGAIIVANTTVAAAVSAVPNSNAPVIVPLVAVSALATSTLPVAVENITLAAATDLTTGKLAAASLTGSTLYVTGTATKDTGLTGWEPTGLLKIVGTLSVRDAFTLPAATKVNVADATIDASAAAAPFILTTPTAFVTNTFKTSANTANAVTVATAASATIHALNGNAQLILPASTETISITGGNGNVVSQISTGALVDNALFGNTGTTTFSTTLGTESGGSKDITVKGDLVLGSSLTFTAASDTLTIANGKSIYAGTAKVLTAVGDTKLTSAATAVLTGTVGTKTISVGTGGVTITSGELNVVGGSTLDIGTAGPVVVTGKLSLAGGSGAANNGKITLTGSGTLKAGDMVISVGSGTLTASGAKVTIDATGIKGASSAAVLTAGTGAVITIHNNATNASATVTFDSVNVIRAGNVVINSGSTSSNIGTLRFINGAKLSGIKGNGTAATVAMTSTGSVWGGTGLTTSGLSATSTAGTAVAPTEFIAQTAANTPGELVATFSGSAKTITINDSTEASVDGA